MYDPTSDRDIASIEPPCTVLKNVVDGSSDDESPIRMLPEGCVMLLHQVQRELLLRIIPTTKQQRHERALTQQTLCQCRLESAKQVVRDIEGSRGHSGRIPDHERCIARREQLRCCA